VTIVVAYPLATQAQGDEGNAIALRHRLALRGIEATILLVDEGALPKAAVILFCGLD